MKHLSEIQHYGVEFFGLVLRQLKSSYTYDLDNKNGLSYW